MLLLLALACGPRLPEALVVGPMEPLPVEPGILPWPAFGLLETPLGLLLTGGPESVLLRCEDPAGAPEACGSPLTWELVPVGKVDGVVGVSADGVLLLLDPHGDYGWDLRNHVWTSEPGVPWSGTDASFSDGILRFGACTMTLPPNPRPHVAAHPKARPGADTPTTRQLDRPRKPAVVAADVNGGRLVAALETGQPGAVRVVVAEVATCAVLNDVQVPVRYSFQAEVAMGEDLAWLAVNGVLRAIRLDGDHRWRPAEGVGLVHGLGQTSAGTVWALGDGAWSYEGGRWVSRAVMPRRYASTWYTYPADALGAVTSSASSGRLFEGDTACGNASLPPFRVVSGTCARWIGIGADAVLRSSSPLPPLALDQPWTLSEHGDTLLVAGRGGVARFRGGAWAELEAEPTCAVDAAGGGWWLTDTARVCHATSAGADCWPLEAHGRGGPWCLERAVAADDEGAWVADNHRLLRVTATGVRDVDEGAEVRWVVADPGRGVLWTVQSSSRWGTADTLAARHPRTGEVLRTFPLEIDRFADGWKALRVEPGGALRIVGMDGFFRRIREAAPGEASPGTAPR